MPVAAAPHAEPVPIAPSPLVQPSPAVTAPPTQQAHLGPVATAAFAQAPAPTQASPTAALSPTAHPEATTQTTTQTTTQVSGPATIDPQVTAAISVVLESNVEPNLPTASFQKTSLPLVAAKSNAAQVSRSSDATGPAGNDAVVTKTAVHAATAPDSQSDNQGSAQGFPQGSDQNQATPTTQCAKPRVCDVCNRP